MTYLSIALLVAVFLLGLFAVQLWRIVQGYRKATGTPWQRFLAAFSDSATILWARILAFGSGAISFGISFLPALDPTSSIGTALQTVLQPKYVPWYTLAIAVIFEIVRRRPGSIDPITPPAQDKP